MYLGLQNNAKTLVKEALTPTAQCAATRRLSVELGLCVCMLCVLSVHTHTSVCTYVAMQQHAIDWNRTTVLLLYCIALYCIVVALQVSLRVKSEYLIIGSFGLLGYRYGMCKRSSGALMLRAKASASGLRVCRTYVLFFNNRAPKSLNFLR